MSTDTTQETAETTEEPSVAEALSEGQPVEEAVEETTEETPEQPSSPSLTDELARLGFSDVSETDAQQRLLQAYRQQAEEVSAMRQRQEQLEALAQYGNQYLTQMQQQQAPQPVEEGPQQDSWWNPPQVNQQLVDSFRERTTDENGNVRTRWKEGTPADVRAQAEAYDRYVEQWAEKLVRNPTEVLPSIIEKEFDRLFEERYQNVQTQQQQQEVMEGILAANQEWLYETDPRTRQIAVDPSGTPRFTPAGQLAIQYLQQAENMGIQNPQDQWQYVTMALNAMSAQAQQQQQRTPEQARREHLQAAQPTPNRGGSLETPEQPLSRPQNANLSPGHQLLEQLRAEGEV